MVEEVVEVAVLEEAVVVVASEEVVEVVIVVGLEEVVEVLVVVEEGVAIEVVTIMIKAIMEEDMVDGITNNKAMVTIIMTRVMHNREILQEVKVLITTILTLLLQAVVGSVVTRVAHTIRHQTMPKTAMLSPTTIKLPVTINMEVRVLMMEPKILIEEIGVEPVTTDTNRIKMVRITG